MLSIPHTDRFFVFFFDRVIVQGQGKAVILPVQTVPLVTVSRPLTHIQRGAIRVGYTE